MLEFATKHRSQHEEDQKQHEKQKQKQKQNKTPLADAVTKSAKENRVPNRDQFPTYTGNRDTGNR